MTTNNLINSNFLQDHYGLKLRYNGSHIVENLIIKRPIGCNRLGISYLAFSNTRNKAFVVREFIPAIRSKIINENLSILNKKGINEFNIIDEKIVYRAWIPGTQLEAYILSEGRIDISYTIKIGRAIANHLNKLHSRDLIHGSLHENNIILDDKIAVIDNCLPSIIRDGSFRELKGQIFDSTTHISPERLRGRPFHQSSDWYSLASILWRMCTGLPPYYVGDIVNNKIEGKPFDSQFFDNRDYHWFKELLLDMLVTNPTLRLSDSNIISNAFESKSYKIKTKQIIKEKENEKIKSSNEDKRQLTYPKLRHKFIDPFTKVKTWSMTVLFLLIVFLSISVLFNIRDKKNIKHLNKEIEVLKEKNKILEQMGPEFTISLEQVQIEKKDIKNKYESKEDSISKVLLTTKQHLMNSKIRIDSLKLTVNNIEKNNESAKIQFEEQINGLNNKIKDRDQNIQNLIQEKTSLQNGLEKIKKTNKELSDSLEIIKKTYNDFKKPKDEIKELEQDKKSDDKNEEKL